MIIARARARPDQSARSSVVITPRLNAPDSGADTLRHQVAAATSTWVESVGAFTGADGDMIGDVLGEAIGM